MPKSPTIDDISEDFKIRPRDRERLLQILEKLDQSGNARFLDDREIITRALEVYLTWELEPEKILDELKKVKLTQSQENALADVLAPKVPGEVREFYSTEVEQNLQQAARKSTGDYNAMLANLASAKDGIKSSTEYISFLQPDGDTNELKEISYDGWPLIWNFYSRLLPTKITLTALGDLMNAQASLWIELGEFRVKAFDVSEELSEELRRFEQEKKLDRTKKISTGFPKPLNPNKETARLVEKRFKDKYAANIRKNTKTGEYHLEGALAALGLITVKKFLGAHYVTMTDLGKKFYQLDNPVLNGDYSHAFSNDEVKLIIEKLIPQRELEDRLCKQALKIVKTFGEYEIEQAAKLNDFFNQEFQSFVDDSSIDEIHKKRLREEFIAPSTSDTEQTPIEACRVATMGRLSELGLIKWKIGPNTSSEYTIIEEVRS